MKLSPEEKKRIYEEEKTRLEAQDKIKAEKLQEETKKKSQSTGKVVIGCLMLAAILVIIGVAIGTCGKDSDSPKYTASPELQQQRLTWINNAIAEGIFYKVEVPGSVPHLWVTPTFMGLSYDDKESFVNVVWSYYICQNPDYDTVILYDSISGKQVGEYSVTYGGLKLDL